MTHSSPTWVFIRTWRSVEFIRVAVAIIDRHYGDPNSELAILGKNLSAVGIGASLNSLSGASDSLVGSCKKYLGSRYKKTLVDNPIFDVRLLKRCLQKAASVVFGTLDTFLTTEFIVTHLKGRSIETGCNRGSLSERQSRQATFLSLG